MDISVNRVLELLDQRYHMIRMSTRVENGYFKIILSAYYDDEDFIEARGTTFESAVQNLMLETLVLV